MMADNNRQNTESIRDIVKQIDSNQLVLPDFQRDFVWDESKTYDLFDSLVRDIFIGSIIYGIPSFEITVREIDKRIRKRKGKRRESLKTFNYSKEEIENKVKIGKFRAVLDGQQRLTALYRALKKIDEVWLIIKDEDELNIEEREFNELSLEELLVGFNGKQDKNRLSLNVGDIFEIMEKNCFEKQIRNNYFSKLDCIEELDEDTKECYFERYLIVSRKMQDLFKAEKLVSYFLLDMSSDKFALFFERSNSLGVRLDFIDILVAKLNSGFRLRAEIEKLQDTVGYTVEREVLVRSIAYIVSEGKDVDKGYILSSLTYDHFNKYWELVCNLYKSVVDFLYNNNFVMTQDWIPHTNMLIPIMMFLNNLPNRLFSQMNQEQLEFIKYWYWGSIFSKRYTGGATNEVIIRDSRNLIKVALGNKINDLRYFRSFKMGIEQPEDLLSFNKKGSALYKGILTFINYKVGGLKDWTNNSKITFTEKVDDHHIFPKAYIQAGTYEESTIDLVDCVVNRTLIPKITNIIIGKKAPSIYLNELSKKNMELKECIKKHLIPEEVIEGLYDEFFEDFVEERAKIIFNEISKEVIDKKQQIQDMFYQEPRKNIGKTVPIFAKYRGKVINATYNRETQEVLLNGEKYNSVSTAANVAKKIISGKENASTNGWKFWKYKDEDTEKMILDIRY